MKLTNKEQEMCREYSQLVMDEKLGYITQCNKCPLCLSIRHRLCYANIDGRTTFAKKLKRY